MTDIVNPSKNRPADSYFTATALSFGGAGDGFVVNSSDETRAAIVSDITEGDLDEFNESSSGSNFDVDIQPGEAFVYGSWVARDTETTVTLDSDTDDQTVYVGWDHENDDEVIIGTDGDFTSDNPRIPIWEFDTDGSGVTDARDQRRIGYSQDIEGKEYFGDEDFSIAYNSSTDELEIIDEENDTVKQSFDKSGDVFFPEGRAHAQQGLTVEGGDLLDGAGNTVYDISANELQSGRLDENSVSIAGNSVSLGGSTNVDYVDLNDTGSSFPIPNSDLDNDSITIEGNSVSLGGSTSVNHNDLSSISDDDHHTKTTSSDIDHDQTVGGTDSDAHHTRFSADEVDSTNWDDYEIQKNGSDENGVINFKT